VRECEAEEDEEARHEAYHYEDPDDSCAFCQTDPTEDPNPTTKMFRSKRLALPVRIGWAVVTLTSAAWCLHSLVTWS
jgi:hypothetical protein